MSRWIDADALIDRLDYCVKEGMGSTIAFTFKHMVEDAPTIEPKCGEWNKPDYGMCSNCHRYAPETENGFYLSNFCPNCGCAMTKE